MDFKEAFNMLTAPASPGLWLAGNEGMEKDLGFRV